MEKKECIVCHKPLTKPSDFFYNSENTTRISFPDRSILVIYGDYCSTPCMDEVNRWGYFELKSSVYFDKQLETFKKIPLRGLENGLP